jgi:hypothetical protein
MLDAGLDEKWEDEGGRRREFLDACVHLHYDLLGGKPWEQEALYAGDPKPPEWMKNERERVDYARAHQLHGVLEVASAARRAARTGGST